MSYIGCDECHIGRDECYIFVMSSGCWIYNVVRWSPPQRGFMSKLKAIPVTLKKANDFVARFHRHNGRTARNGGKFAIGVGVETDTDVGFDLVGVAIVGNPLSASYMDGYTAEVLRVCTSEDAPKGSNSFLYARCWRAWRAMGGRRLITYTLTTESGASLRGAGWRILHKSGGHNDWASKSRLDGLERKWQPIYAQEKFCWVVDDGNMKE